MDLRQTRCPLLLVADYRFFSEMGGGSSKTTVNYLISLIDRYICVTSCVSRETITA